MLLGERYIYIYICTNICYLYRNCNLESSILSSPAASLLQRRSLPVCDSRRGQVSKLHTWLELRVHQISAKVASTDLRDPPLQTNRKNTRPPVQEPQSSAAAKSWMKAPASLPCKFRK